MIMSGEFKQRKCPQFNLIVQCLRGQLTGGIAHLLNEGKGERHGPVHLEEKARRQIHTVGVGHIGKGRCSEVGR